MLPCPLAHHMAVPRHFGLRAKVPLANVVPRPIASIGYVGQVMRLHVCVRNDTSLVQEVEMFARPGDAFVFSGNQRYAAPHSVSFFGHVSRWHAPCSPLPPHTMPTPQGEVSGPSQRTFRRIHVQPFASCRGPFTPTAAGDHGCAPRGESTLDGESSGRLPCHA